MTHESAAASVVYELLYAAQAGATQPTLAQIARFQDRLQGSAVQGEAAIYDAPAALPAVESGELRPTLDYMTQVADRWRTDLEQPELQMDLELWPEELWPELRFMQEMRKDTRDFNKLTLECTWVSKCIGMVESNVRLLYQQQG